MANTNKGNNAKDLILPDSIVKRDDSVVDFDPGRVKRSIYKAMIATGNNDPELLDKISRFSLETISRIYVKKKTPSVEEIQDIIEVSIMKSELFEVAKAYILYRNIKAKERNEKKKLLGKTKLDYVEKKFSLNSLRVLASRYLLKDEKGNFLESLSGLFKRVSVSASLSEIIHDKRVFSKEKINLDTKEKDLEFIKGLKEKYTEYDNVFSVGKFRLNKYHFLTLLNILSELIKQGHFKVTPEKFLDMLKQKEFEEVEEKFQEVYDLLAAQDFMPNTPALINAGRKLGMLSACFTLEIGDSMETILKAAHDVAMIQKAGGGNGINFSSLRPKNDSVGSTAGVSSGPVSFMNLINAVSEVIKQGGVRRGANMGILNSNHPDIEEFIKSKEKDGTLNNFNISVGTDKDFWNALFSKKQFPLINPRTKEVQREITPTELFDLISYFAWATADPGLLFFDNINKYNVLIGAKKGKLDITNPCGEEPLYPYESCNLASINLSNFVLYQKDEPKFDWERFDSVTQIVARVLDNMIDINNYPLPEIDYNTKLTRRIGVGIMGLADAMFKLKIKYNSSEGYKFMEKISEHLTFSSYKASASLSRERGTFPIYDKSDYTLGKLPIEGFYKTSDWSLNWNELISEIKENGLRNAMVTTNPPTGSVSMISDTTSGIEPVFALVFEKRVLVGNFYYVDPVFKLELKKRGLYNEELLKKISDNYGSVQGIDEVPKDLQEIFVTAMDIHWLDHVVAQSVLQKWVTDSISKTINMPADATIDEIKSAYVLAHELGCKGITVYRDGSKKGQVLNITSEVKKKAFEPKPSNFSLKLIDAAVKSNPKIIELIDVKSLKKEENLKLELFSDTNFSKKNTRDKKNNSNEKTEIKINNPSMKASLHVSEKKHDENLCPVCSTKIVHESGCNICPNCGWSECTIS